MVEIRAASTIVAEYNKNITELLKRFEARSAAAEKVQIERLRARIRLAKSVMGQDILINKTGHYLLSYYDKIINRDETFFNTLDIAANYKIDKSNEFVIGFAANIRAQYAMSTQVEKDTIYQTVRLLLEDYMEWKLAIAR